MKMTPKMFIDYARLTFSPIGYKRWATTYAKVCYAAAFVAPFISGSTRETIALAVMGTGFALTRYAVNADVIDARINQMYGTSITTERNSRHSLVAFSIGMPMLSAGIGGLMYAVGVDAAPILPAAVRVGVQEAGVISATAAALTPIFLVPIALLKRRSGPTPPANTAG